jgi:hypothetical protein
LVSALVFGQLNAQIAYEIRMSNPGFQDYFKLPVIDSNGNVYVNYHYWIPNSIPGKSCLYKINKNGDTTRFEIEKQDTILYFSPYVDSDNNLLLWGAGFRIDTIGIVSGFFRFYAKLNTKLELVWQRIYHLDSDSIADYSGIFSEHNQRRYIHAAEIKNTYSGQFKYFSFEMNKDGDSLNQVFHDEDLAGPLYSITFNETDTSLVEYHKTVYEGSDSDCGRVVYDGFYNPISKMVYPDEGFRTPFYTLRIPANKYLSAGRYGYTSGNIQLRVMDNELNVLKSINLCPSNNETCAAWTKCIDYFYPNRIFVAGMTPYFSNTTPNYIYIACLDEDLNLIHEEFIGGEYNYDVESICATPDGGVVIAGGYRDLSVQPVQMDGYLIKLDSGMFVGIPEYQNNISTLSVEIFPNPNSGQLNVRSNSDKLTIEVLDLTGKSILKCHMNNFSGNIDISNLKPGLYFLKSKSGKHYSEQKLIIY